MHTPPRQSDSEEDEDSSSSEDEESGSESSSSSGSSIGLKRTNNKGKPQHDDEDSEGEGSDDDFVSGNLKPEEIAAAAAAFASAHEVLEPNLPPPPVDSIPLDAPIRSIGFIDHIINSVIVIRADINSEESIQGQILDEGSLLCLSDRRVLGAIFETFGSINAPYYSIRLPPGHQLIVKRTTSDGGESEPVQPGMQVYYSPTPDFSGLLYTRDIRQMQMKGSDASNLYDEEVGENEIEFSDDEQETAYRRDLKQRKKERWMDKHQGAQPDSAEFEFDEDFDDTASLRSNADRSVETALHDSEEEGAIAEATGSHKRRLSTSTVASQQSGQHNKSARMDGHSGHTRGRGGRQDRGRGRGRGVSGGPNGQSRGRGGARRGAERGRGPGPRGGSFIGQRSPPTHQARPHLPQGLPPRPSYQHPDALPYDDVPTAAFAAPRSVSPTRAQHALPARPSTGVEAYDPSVPHGHALPPPRGMNALAPSWSPVQGGPGSPGSYVPSVPFFGQHMPQQYLPPTFGGQQVYNQAAQSYMQPGQYYVPHAHSADRNTGDQYQPR